MDNRKRDEYEALLLGMMGMNTSKIIPQQEKRGQRELVNSAVLPRQINHGSLQQFEQMGIVFGEIVDDLFIRATLPDGWKKVPTDHDMWSHLVDDQGRERASIFYKAAFYDRDAFMSLTQRFTTTTQPVGGYGSKHDDNTPYECVVLDGGQVIWTSKPLQLGKGRDRWELQAALQQQGIGLLDENYPMWRDPTAYWD